MAWCCGLARRWALAAWENAVTSTILSGKRRHTCLPRILEAGLLLQGCSPRRCQFCRCAAARKCALQPPLCLPTSLALQRKGTAVHPNVIVATLAVGVVFAVPAVAQSTTPGNRALATEPSGAGNATGTPTGAGGPTGTMNALGNGRTT